MSQVAGPNITEDGVKKYMQAVGLALSTLRAG